MLPKKKKVSIGLVQMQCAEKSAENLAKAIAGIRDCAKRGAQIIALPELFLSPYFCQGEKDDKWFETAESIPGPTTEALSKVARETKTVLIVPLFEKTAEGKFFNSTAVLGPDGKIIGVYHKMHIPSLPPDLYAENYYFEKGDKGFTVFDTPYGKIAALICYDQWFPEAARMAAAQGAQILFYPTAIGWPQIDRAEKNKAEYEAWQIIQRSHAIANNVFVAPVNRIGLEGNIKFWGTSFVSDPYGRVLAKASTGKEENLVQEIDLGMIEKMREEWPFLLERRIQCEQQM